MSDKSERGVALRNNDQSNLREMTLDNAVRDITSIQKEDVYYAKGKKGYSAKIYRALAIEQGIRTKIVEYGKDADKAWVKVEAWKGDRESPDAFGEAVVIQRHQDTMRESIFDAISNGMTVTEGWDPETRRPIQRKINPPFDIGTDGFPRLTDPKHMLQLMKNHLHEISIIERKLATIATRNATRNLIEGPGEEGEEEEKQDRRSERRTSESSTKKEASSPQPEDVKGSNELTELADKVREIVLRICDGNPKLAKEFFLDFTSNLEGIPPADSPGKIQSVAQMTRIFEALKRLHDNTPLTAEVEEEDLSL